MSSKNVNSSQPTGIIPVAKLLYKNGGFTQFYKGFGAQWFGFAPFTIIQLVLWEQLRS
jgi:hypothetical protein